MLLSASIPAATAVVGYDLIEGNSLKQSDKPRSLIAAALAGSAAALDTVVDLFVGQVKVGGMYNSAVGAPNRDHLFRIGVYVPANQEVHAYVVDAPATNPINIILDFQE